MDIWQHLEQQITQASGSAFHLNQNRSVGGGCINAAFRVSDGRRSYFVKTNSAAYASMFEAEAEALGEMTSSATVRVPEPVCYGRHGDQCYIVMEYLELGGSADMADFGRQLAAMHRVTDEYFGWPARDNGLDTEGWGEWDLQSDDLKGNNQPGNPFGAQTFEEFFGQTNANDQEKQ